MSTVTPGPAPTPEQMILTASGLVLGPMISGALSFGGPELANDLARPEFFSHLPGFTYGEAILAGLLGFLPALIVGWPLHVMLLRRGLTTRWHYVGFGAVVFGVLLAGMSLLTSLLKGEAAKIDLLSLYLVVGGAVGGWVFWVIRRPDRDAGIKA